MEDGTSPAMSVADQSYVQVTYSQDVSMGIHSTHYVEEKSFALKPINSEKEFEQMETIRDMSILADDRTVKFSPEYKPEDNYGVNMNLSKDQFESRESENMNATFTSGNFRQNLDSPSTLFRFLSDGLKLKTTPKLNFKRWNDVMDLSNEMMLKTGNVSELGREELRKGRFILNPISIDEHIMVPEIANNRDRQQMSTLDLGASFTSDKSKNKEI